MTNMRQRKKGEQLPLPASRIGFHLLLLRFHAHIAAVYAFSAPNGNSPWKPASWQFVLNIGREASTTLPEGWGQSGARLWLPLEISAQSDRLSDAEQDPLLGRGANRLTVVDEAATYINEQGEQRVPIRSGGWKLRMGRKKGYASFLRFWLDIGSNNSNSNNRGNNNPIVAQKNDVTLQANERLYFAALCWRQTDYEIGRRKLQPILEAYQRAQAKVEQQVDHDSGDRRLDGTDALETLAAYKDMAGLTFDRDDKRRRLIEAQEYLPPPEKLPLGNWPGSTELLAVQPMEIFVRRRQGILPGEDYHLIGNWKAKPFNVISDEIDEKKTLGSREDYIDDINNDDEYELYDEEDDDDQYEYYEDDEEEENAENDMEEYSLKDSKKN